MYENFIQEAWPVPEAWTIPSAVPVEPATINFPARASVNATRIDPIERSWIDDSVSAVYNDIVGRLAYNPTLTTGPHLVYSNNSISWTANPLIWPEDEKDDLVEDVDLSMFI